MLSEYSECSASKQSLSKQLSRKVIDLLGNHLLPASTTGACIFFGPVSYTTERLKLEKVHDLPHGHVRAGCSLSWCSTEVQLGVSLTLLAILGRDFPQITNLLVRVALSLFLVHQCIAGWLRSLIPATVSTPVWVQSWNHSWKCSWIQVCTATEVWIAALCCKGQMLKAKRCLEKEEKSKVWDSLELKYFIFPNIS